MSRADQALAGRTVAVFGAGTAGEGTGNGMAAAMAYARAGARVIAVDRDAAAVETTANAIASEGFSAEQYLCDVADAAQVGEVVAAIGPIDVVHNNVGIFRPGGVLSVTTDDFMQVLNVNLLGAFNTVRAALPGMLSAGRGAIINISSIGGRRYYPNMLTYQVSKAALESFTVATAMEFASRGVRSNAIIAGLIDTPLVRGGVRARYASDEEMIASLSLASPTGAMGKPWDLANAAVFLASDAAAYVNGAMLTVDGGAVWRA